MHKYAYTSSNLINIIYRRSNPSMINKVIIKYFFSEFYKMLERFLRYVWYMFSCQPIMLKCIKVGAVAP